MHSKCNAVSTAHSPSLLQIHKRKNQQTTGISELQPFTPQFQTCCLIPCSLDRSQTTFFAPAGEIVGAGDHVQCGSPAMFAATPLPGPPKTYTTVLQLATLQTEKHDNITAI